MRVVGSLAATAALLSWVGWKLDLSAVWRSLADVRPGWVIAAAALGPLQVGLSAERWRDLSGALGRPLPRGWAWRQVALSVVLNQLLPGGLAGDAVRAWRASGVGAEPAGLGASARAVVADRLVGLMVHLAAVGVGLALWSAASPGTIPAGAVAVSGATALVLAGLVVAGPLAPDLRVALAPAGAGPRIVGASVVLTASFVVGFGWCGLALGAPLGPTALAAVPLVMLAMALPIGFGGFGIREATAVVVLPRCGVGAEAAVAIAALYGVSAALGSLPGALVPVWESQWPTPR
ncbi:MAG: lysylphosphatidylglycerol synthase transmembrane domain-containing protein [Myxococcota bacterium]